MWPLVLSTMLSATPSVVVLPFETAGLEPRVVNGWVDRFGLLMGEGQRVKVISQQDLQAVLGLERQRQMLGCEAQVSCLAELAGGLGAEGVLRGGVTRSGKSISVTVKLLRGRDGSTWLDATTRASSEDEAQEFLDATARAFRDQIAPPPVTAQPTWVRWLPALGGVLLAGGGAACLGLSFSKRADLSGTTQYSELQIAQLVSDGRTFELVGSVLAGAAGAAVLTSVVWALVGGSSSSPSVIVSPASGGAVLLVGWRL